jgi:predicted nucleic acid-binding protein
VIVVDTSVWSLSLRRPTGTGAPPHAARLLRTLIEDGQPVWMPGIVKQELLSGIRHEAQFDRMLRVLEPFQNLIAIEADHVLAAKVANSCRANGVQVGAVDALIVAMTLRLNGILLTTDRDYQDIHNHVAFNLQWLPST